eukprot:c3544_g1_i1.p1 GENE.c3544_g1_i1~~c3544_g1_i1.p1  ORF type:complete len:387 (-),score=104.03 c3544_g1_i1:184-1308(-)
MSWEEALSKANGLFVDGSFEEALDFYDEAMNSRGEQDAQILSKRSACNAKLLNFAEAFADVDQAISLDPQNAKFLAQKGAIFYSKEDFKEAKEIYEKANAIDATSYRIWIRKCDAEQKLKESKSNSAWATTTVSPTPAQSPDPEPEIASSSTTASSSTVTVAPQETTTTTTTPASSNANPKHEWYQNADAVIVSIFAKNLTPEQIQHSFTPTHLSVSIRVDPEKDDVWRWEVELCDTIVPEESNLRIGKPKIEIRLKKSMACKWESLEKKETDFPTRNWVDTSAMNKHSYPSSSKNKKDWSFLDKEAEKAAKEEVPSGDAAVQSLFQQIYSKADEDTRRAMNKSYVESGGTVLSTNWKDVGARKVDGGPPPSRK